MKNFIFILLLTVLSCQEKTVVFKYQNPILDMDFRDTHIIPEGDKYYAVGTCAPYWGGVNPGVKLYSSDDLTHWKFEKLLIDASRLDSTVWYKDRFWAPELRRIGNKYYLTFNCQNNSGDYGDVAGQKHYHACGVAVSDRIDGEYTVMTPDEPLTPFASNDLSLFQDEDGKVYAFFNNGWTDLHRIYVAEMDPEKCRLKEEPVELIRQEPGKWDGAGIEGSHVIKKDGTYYLFYSSWTRGYAVGYATATDIRGPWQKYGHNPLFGAFSENDTTYLFREGEIIPAPDCDISGIGHNQIFIGPDGRYWTSYHGYKKGVQTAITLIDPIWFEGENIKTNTPTYTPQEIKITSSGKKKNQKIHL